MNRFLELRQNLGLTQQEFADKLGVTQQAVYNYEHNRNFPDIVVIIKMSDMGNVSADYLLGNTNIKQRADKMSETVLNESELMLLRLFRKIPTSLKEEINRFLLHLYQIVFHTHE